MRQLSSSIVWARWGLLVSAPLAACASAAEAPPERIELGVQRAALTRAGEPAARPSRLEPSLEAPDAERSSPRSLLEAAGASADAEALTDAEDGTSGIIGGSVDNGDPSVVMLLNASGGGFCSGTPAWRGASW